jgi:hypothetical protein
MDELNPMNLHGSLGQTGLSMWDATAGIATLDWDRAQDAWMYGPLGQSANARGWEYYGTRTALGAAGLAAASAGGLIAAEWVGFSNIGSARLGWKGGEITLTRPGNLTPDFRLNPFGGSGFPPHYHRRPGIKHHRPWQGGW